MLLTITTTGPNADELGHLLHKNPYRCQVAAMPFGAAHVFYPEATAKKCAVCLLLDIDPVGLVRDNRGKNNGPALEQYVNDRPYVCSSFMSVALAKVFGSALNGNCAARPELPARQWDFQIVLTGLPCRGREDFLHNLFEPLGYEVESVGCPLDPAFPQWGQSPYFEVTLRKRATLAELLGHLYVLIPVLDNNKHYYVGRDEIDKLLKRGAGWLATHPLKEQISRRYLKFQPGYAREALARLNESLPPDSLLEDEEAEAAETVIEEKISLNDERMGVTLSLLKSAGARSVIDLGCGGGKFVKRLLREPEFERIAGCDVAIRSLEVAAGVLRLDRMPDKQRQRLELFQASLTYRDQRFAGYDAAVLMEVIEHLDEARLPALERVVFEFAAAKTVIVTTPNREYNVMWENVGSDKFRHNDHRFEWTRAEFADWARGVGERHGYGVRFLTVGPEEEGVGAPTGVAVFAKMEPEK